MKILLVASEAVPFVKTGGLADVVGALAPVLAGKGHDVRVILPYFSAIPHEFQDQMSLIRYFRKTLKPVHVHSPFRSSFRSFVRRPLALLSLEDTGSWPISGMPCGS